MTKGWGGIFYPPLLRLPLLRDSQRLSPTKISEISNMKLLLVTLVVFAISPGSPAFVLRSEPDFQLAQLNQELKDYLSNITRGVNEKVDWLARSALGQQLVDRVHGGISKVRQRLRSLEAELPPEVTGLFDLVVEVSLGLGEKALHTLAALKRRLRPASQELSEKLYSILAPYANSVLKRVGPYTEALRQALAARTEGLNPQLNEKLRRQLEELRNQLSPYVQKLQEQVQELQAKLEPIAGQAQETFQQGVKNVSQRLQPYVAPVLKALREYAKDLKKWVGTPSIS